MVEYFELAQDLKRHLGKRYAIRREVFAKALGITGTPGRIIWDLTCGTAKDSILMLAYGAKVIAFERNPIVFEMLQKSLQLAYSDPEVGELIKKNFLLYGVDALKASECNCEPCETVYLDPMYPHDKKRTALPRKEMVWFRDVVGDDNDSEQLLNFALSLNAQRVVVKRSKSAPPIKAGFAHQFFGNSTRYDLYLPTR